MGQSLHLLHAGRSVVEKLKQIHVEGILDGKPGEWRFDVQESSPEKAPLPQLWAREKIRDLENSTPGISLISPGLCV